LINKKGNYVPKQKNLKKGCCGIKEGKKSVEKEQKIGHCRRPRDSNPDLSPRKGAMKGEVPNWKLWPLS
jgi:hypothetical protein